jgi:uncharacterized integral membrane protein
MSREPKATVRFGWLGGAGALLAIAACYGTLAVLGALSLLGVTLAINEAAWAGAISLFAVIAVAGMAFGYSRHRVKAPLIIAVVGAALILWAMFVSYSRIVEICGFAALIAAAVWDWRLTKGAGGREAAPKTP